MNCNPEEASSFHSRPIVHHPLPSSVANSPADQLERCGHWLSSIPRDDVSALRSTQEYSDFLRAFERLGQAHRRVISLNRNSHEVAPSDWSIPNNFLQYLTADDVILRIFEFLECKSLIRMAFTCSRFRQLANGSATQRTCDVMSTRKLQNVMQLLRAKEQIDGVGVGIDDNHVRVPILLLGRRMLVTDAGDPEYNGVYFCTGCNGNGFVFTKPRYQECRTLTEQQASSRSRENIPHRQMEIDQQIQNVAGEVAPAGFAAPMDQGRGAIGIGPTTHVESEIAQPGQLLRCIIAKRFSNETILWYLSKEVVSSESGPDSVAASERITQVFSFWAKLMVIGDASLDICRYPSLSSILARHGEQWNPLTTTTDLRPPTVELLD